MSVFCEHSLAFPKPDKNTCLSQEIFDQGILEAKPLAPGFAAPEPEGMDHHLYSMHIEKSLPEETPAMFGMPANAEIGYLTNAAEEIFAAFLRWVRRSLGRDTRTPFPPKMKTSQKLGAPHMNCIVPAYCSISNGSFVVPPKGWRRLVPARLPTRWKTTIRVW